MTMNDRPRCAQVPDCRRMGIGASSPLRAGRPDWRPAGDAHSVGVPKLLPRAQNAPDEMLTEGVPKGFDAGSGLSNTRSDNQFPAVLVSDGTMANND